MSNRKTALLKLRHMKEQCEATREAMKIEGQRFEKLANQEVKAVAAVKLLQTPEDIAELRVEQIIELAGELHGKRILEPSAGLGRLYSAVRHASSKAHITLVENSPQCSKYLYGLTNGDLCQNQIQGDFLACDQSRLGGMFDCALMNPPFKNGLDIKHIKHAYRFLKPGGVIVAICSAGPRQQRAFSQWHQSPLPEKTFSSEGTNARTMIVSRIKDVD